MSIKTDEIKIPAHDEGAFKAFIAKPEDCKDAPAIIVIQEIFGINQDMRNKCIDLAQEGYIAICPDLFWRIQPDIELVDSDPVQLEKAFELYNTFDENTGLYDLKTTLGYARNIKGCNNKIGAIGYCLGGKLAYLMACHSDIDATIGYYGVAIETMLEHAENIDSPLMLHIAEEDEFVNKDAQEQIKSTLGGNNYITIHSYPGTNHAFARIDGMHFNADAAHKANEASTDFLKTYLRTEAE